MRNLFKIGRVFYGIAIVAMGFLSIYYKDFPYMLIPERHSRIPGLVMLAYISGVMLILTGASIVFGKKTRPVSLLLGGVLLLIFCFYFIPYQFFVSAAYMHFGDWENAAKELALCGGAFVIARCFPEKNEKLFTGFPGKLAPYGAILFPITIISFGTDHFLYAKEAADYVPSWVPNHLFWMYVTGTALIASGIAIILQIKVRLAACLLGSMIFIWFIILHIPYVIASSLADRAGEVTSAFLALAYSGIAFAIAGSAKKQQLNKMDTITYSKIKKMSPQLLVADIGRSIEFYTKKLGFHIDFYYKDFYSGISKEGFSIHLKAGKPSIEERQNRRNNEDLDIVFSVEGIEGLCEELSSKLVEFIQPLREMDYGREFYIADPDGYIIAFLEEAISL